MKAKYLLTLGNNHLFQHFGKYYIVSTLDGTARARYLAESYVPIHRIQELSEEELHERYPYGLSFIRADGLHVGVSRKEQVGYIYTPTWQWEAVLQADTYKDKILEMLTKTLNGNEKSYIDPTEHVTEYDERPNL